MTAVMALPLAAIPSVAQPSIAHAQPEVRADIEHLRSTNPTERARAAEALGRSGHALREEITPLLRGLLRDDPEWEVRASAGRALGRLGTRDAVPDLVRALRDPVVDVRVVAAAAIWRLPDPAAVPALLELLHDGDANARQWATLALGVIRDTRSVAPLIELLDDPVPAVRLDVIRSLGRIRNAGALTALEARASSASAPNDERVEAVDALAVLEAPQRLDALVRLLGSRERRVREAAITALGQVGDALAVPPLRRQRGSERVPSLRTAIDDAIASIESRRSPASAD
jgi:HEAT repeat protein